MSHDRMIHFALPALLAVALPASGAPKRDYSYETDPIRVGTKALEEDRLEDAKRSFEQALADEYQIPKAKLGLAEVAMGQGRNAEAERLCREALDAQYAEAKQESDKRFAEAHARLGLLLIKSGRWDEAKQEIDIALRQKQGLWLANYGQARLLLREHKWEEAKPVIERGKKRKGKYEGEDLYHHAEALYLLGTGDVKGAEVEALYAFKMNIVDAEFGELLGQIYEQRNVPALAIDAYESMLQNPEVKPTAEFVHRLGLLYERAHRYNEARDRYLRAVQIDSTYVPPLKDLGNLLYAAEQYDNAAKVYLRYVAYEPRDFTVQERLAQSFEKLGAYDRAVVHAEAAMGIDSTNVETRLVYARSAIRSRDKAVQAKAVAVFATLPDTVEWRPMDRVLVAGQRIGEGKLEEGRRQLELAIAADSTLAEAYFQMGLLAMKTQKPDSAVVFFTSAVTHDPKSPLYYLNLGVAHFQAGKPSPATAAYRKALELDNRLVIGHILLGQVLAGADSLIEAEAAYEAALKIEPTNAKALRGLGFCNLRQARYPEAIKNYQGASTAEPGNADGWAGLAQAYIGLKDWGGAEEALRRGRAVDPNNAGLRRAQELLERNRAAPP